VSKDVSPHTECCGIAATPHRHNHCRRYRQRRTYGVARTIIVHEDPTKLINFEVQCAANSDAPAYVGTWALSIATELLHTFNDRV